MGEDSSYRLSGGSPFPFAAKHCRTVCIHTDVWINAVSPLMQFGVLTKGGRKEPVPHKWAHSHTHIIGRPEMGQQELTQALALDALKAGNGIAYFDFHGEATSLLERIPPERWDDVLLFDPLDTKHPIGLNLLHNVEKKDQPRIVSLVLDTFHALWPSNITTTNIDRFVRATTAALLQAPSETLIGIYYMLDNALYRQRVLSHSKDSVVTEFWKSFEAIPPKDRRKDAESTLGRMFGLIIDPMIRNIIGQRRNAIESIIDENRILIVSLPIGQIGIQETSLLVNLVLSQLYFSALKRKRSTPYYIFLNDLDVYGAKLVVSMLGHLRNTGVSLTLSHHYIEEIAPELRAAIFGLVNTLVCFRLGPTDAALLEAQFPIDQNRTSLSDLAPFRASIKTPDATFDGVEILSLSDEPNPIARREITTRSRRHFASQEAHVRATIDRAIQGS